MDEVMHLVSITHAPTPIVALNAAVAAAMSLEYEEGLKRIDAIAARGELQNYHLLHAARVFVAALWADG